MAAATPLYPALWTASSLGQTEEVRRLLANDADIEERGGPTECSPLAVAATAGREQLVGLLLHHGAVLRGFREGQHRINAAAFRCQ
jgi:hypothetical protein